ncbi:MAG: ribosome small subunit-dependent GTPase A [Firmicutes bacterium]|nr:ribosome small subunit-dependent GTPase A [Bacillota bacterium]
MLSNGLIIKVNSDTFTVKCDNESIDCKARGKNRYEKIKPLVGDRVLVDKDKKTIEKVLDRKNSLLRPPVANLDIALIVTSLIKPNLSLTLLDKLVSIVTINNIEPVIVFTKLDLVSREEIKKLNKLIKYYENIGIKVFNNKKIRKLKKYLKNKIVTVCGQTGAGKSTLINKLDKNLHLETKEISEALGRGVHTTRIVELFEINNYYIVDTPGFSSIDINNYSSDEIKNSFIEFRNLECKFKDCKHEKELGCRVIEEKNNENILNSRYENYLRFIKE